MNSQNSQNFQINIPEMKRKTEIEEKLLFDINKNFQEYLNDIDYIKKNFVKKNVKFETKKYTSVEFEELETKLFELANFVYSIFQCFYLKRKNYMGMNLTGLVQGRMETGLGFRSSIIKSSYKNLKDSKLITIINDLFYNCEKNNQTDQTNINVYKIKSINIKWDEFNLNPREYVYLVANLDTKEYFFILE